MSKCLIACICEGGAEHAIMDILLDNNAIIFSKSDLLDEKILRTRSAKNFEQEFLRKNFAEKIIFYLILDSRHEKFNLSKLYKNKIEIINVITAPEIEMLVIFAENKYEDFKKKNLKPSDYCKQELKYSNVKSYQFIKNYFKDLDMLIFAINMYHSKSHIQKNELTLHDLLKS